MEKYKTLSGDTWDLIAKRVYGREDLMTLLIEANYDYRKTVFFRAGVLLDVPTVDLAQVADDRDLPPWKRKK